MNPRALTLTLTLTVTATLGTAPAAPAAPAAGCARPATSAAEMNATDVTGVGAADSYRTARLPDGRWMAVTGDTARDGQTLPAYDNSIIIYDRTRQYRSGADTHAFPRWPDGSEFWAGQWVAGHGTRVYVTGSRQLVRGPWDWTAMGAYIAVLDVPRCGSPVFRYYVATPSSGLDDSAVQWYAGIARADGWFYVHGVLDRPDRYHGRDAGYIARFTNPGTSWQFWTGTGWSPNDADAVATIPLNPYGAGGGSESGYTVDRLNGRWTVITKEGGTLGSTLGAYVSASPTGPWTWHPLLQVCDLGCYLTGAAPIPTTSGRLMVNWSRPDAMPAWAEVTLP